MSENKKKVSTKDVSTGGGVPKTIGPGNQKARILSVEIEDLPEAYRRKKPGAVNIKFKLEGPDQGEDFEGFKIDKDDESKGLHAGQVGTVKATEWPFADGETKSGRKIERDRDLMRFLKNLCMQTGCLDWFDAQDDKHETELDLIKAFCNEKPFGDKFFDWCIAGREYKNKQGYPAYDLFLPSFTKDETPVLLEGLTTEALLKTTTDKRGVTVKKLISFDKNTHIRRDQRTETDSFASTTEEGAESEGAAPGVGADFEL